MATLILNARSGGGKHQPAIRVAAERCGWVIREVGPGADPAGLAASADTDVLVVAGGDGTVSAVAAVAVERDLPLVVLPCGTLNHFAADAGLDCNTLTGMARWRTEPKCGSMSVRSTAGCSSTTRRSGSTARWCRIRSTAAGGLPSPTVTAPGDTRRWLNHDVSLTLAPRVVVPDTS